MSTTRADRAEGFILVLILLVVGLAAGAASFTHVHDWTMTNSPAGTPDWFGWANACISELVPVAALLDIRRRRRAGKPPGYPLALLVAAAGLSLSAQLAVAKPGFSGALLSAVPALAFMGLVKLVFASTPTPAVPATPATQAEQTWPPAYVPPVWSAPHQTHQDAPVSPAPAPTTPEVAPAVLDVVATPAPAEEEKAEPTDPRMVTALSFDALPPVGDPDRHPEIRRRAEAFKAEDPKRSQATIADLIGVPRWTLRDAIAKTATQPTSPPALTLVTV